MAGLPKIQRIHAKNFIQDEADKRLHEVVVPYQQQGLNALGVDYHNVLFYLKKPSTQSCTCREIQTETTLGQSANTVARKEGISEVHEISVDWRKPLFGEPNEQRFDEVDDKELNDYDFDDSEVPHANQLIESSVECGICYRHGYLPGFEQYGKQRVVFTTHDLANSYGYTINRSVGPHVFERLHQAGWVEFDLFVPKYFVSASFSIRNNVQILDNVLSLAAGPLGLDTLNQSRGTTIRVRVCAEYFTHLVVVFDLGTSPIHANIAQLSKATDWTLFSTIGNLNVFLPMTIPEVTNGSFIVVPKINLALIVTDVTFLRVATGQNLDWSVNTRVSQPQEPVTKIHKMFPIL